MICLSVNSFWMKINDPLGLNGLHIAWGLVWTGSNDAQHPHPLCPFRSCPAPNQLPLHPITDVWSTLSNRLGDLKVDYCCWGKENSNLSSPISAYSLAHHSDARGVTLLDPVTSLCSLSFSKICHNYIISVDKLCVRERQSGEQMLPVRLCYACVSLAGSLFLIQAETLWPSLTGSTTAKHHLSVIRLRPVVWGAPFSLHNPALPMECSPTTPKCLGTQYEPQHEVWVRSRLASRNSQVLYLNCTSQSNQGWITEEQTVHVWGSS